MVPHYTLVEPVCCSGLNLVGQAFGVSLVEQKVTVVVGQVVEAEDWEESCTGTSTPDEMHSTEVTTKHRIEMMGMILRCEGPRRRRGPRRMRRGAPCMV